MNNMKRCREKAGFTQKEVAISLKVSVQSVSFWEKGERVPSLENAIALAKMYNCSLDAMFMDDTEKSPPNQAGGLKGQVLNRLAALSPDELQRVDDFLSGIQSVHKEQ